MDRYELFISRIAESARAICPRYGLYASVCIAQACIESMWGEAEIGNFNFFGRKAVNDDAHVTLWTKEYYPNLDPSNESDSLVYLGDGWWNELCRFKTYSSADEAVEDYCILLTQEPAYAGVMANVGDLHSFVYALAGDGTNSGVYATNPQYGPDILATIRANDLLQYDDQA